MSKVEQNFIATFRPKINGCETAEPTLDAIMFEYYRKAFDHDDAAMLTNQYIAALTDGLYALRVFT